MSKNKGKFRFAYFTNNYEETCHFYETILELHLEHAWNRNDNDKGSLFKAGLGLIEILQLPNDATHKVQGLDYRTPQGAFMVMQIENIDELYLKLKNKGIVFKQDLVDQDWGHRSFSVEDPNGVVLLYIQDPFDTNK